MDIAALNLSKTASATASSSAWTCLTARRAAINSATSSSSRDERKAGIGEPSETAAHDEVMTVGCHRMLQAHRLKEPIRQ
jgi:hypothetical protein